MKSINGELYNPNNLNIIPTIGERTGFQLAKNHINANKYLWEDIQQAEIVGYNSSNRLKQESIIQLCTRRVARFVCCLFQPSLSWNTGSVRRPTLRTTGTATTFKTERLPISLLRLPPIAFIFVRSFIAPVATRVYRAVTL